LKLFKLPTQLQLFEKFADFAAEYTIGEGDLVLTHQFIYEPFMQDLNLKADFIMQEKFGVGEPSDEMIDAVIEAVGTKSYKRVIAVGGGTVIDIAKLLIFAGSPKTLPMFERKVDFVKSRQLIIVPTTCGTGSEVTNLTIAEIKSKHTKMGLALDEMYPDHAVLIPELVKGLPYKFFVYSSVDALIHATESYLSPNAGPITRMFSLKAVELILKGYMQIAEKGEEFRFEILEQFLLGSNYAGIAFGNAGVGAVHALSYPIGGTWHVPHGEANYEFFMGVFKTYQRINPNGSIKELNQYIADIIGSDVETVYDSLEELLSKLIKLKPLREYGVTEADLPMLTDSVIATQQRLLNNNYVPFTREIILDIYTNLY